VAGIAFIVLFAAGIVTSGDSPMYGDDAGEIRSFFADHSNQYLVGNWLTGLAVVFLFLPFVATLRSVLERAEGAGGTWARTAFVGGLLWAIIGGAASVSMGALAFTKAENLDDSTLLFVVGADWIGFATASFGLALMIAAASAVIIRTGVLWRWMGYAGGIVAAVIIVGALNPVQHDVENWMPFLSLIGQLCGALFVLLSGIQLAMRKTLDVTTAEEASRRASEAGRGAQPT
jgi:hypothetical protein